MAPVGFELTISACEWQQTNALGRAATMADRCSYTTYRYKTYFIRRAQPQFETATSTVSVA